jgi:hypothetical protein
MTTKRPPIVFDPATTAQGLTLLNQHLGNVGWHAVFDNPSQQRFFPWYNENWPCTEFLTGLKMRVAASAEPLNGFFQENGYPAMFRPFQGESVGVAAILKMVKTWAIAAQITSMAAGHDPTGQRYRAFEMPMRGVEIFELPEPQGPLVKILADDGSAAWLAMPGVLPSDGLDLLDFARAAMATRLRANTSWIRSVIVPMVDIETDVSLDWLLGATSAGYAIDQAFQKVTIRLDEKGFAADAGTGIVASRSVNQAVPLEFNRAFIGWFTQPANPTPIALFYATPEQWQPLQG